MVFSSSVFLLYFLPLFLLAYHLTPVKWRNTTALIGSILFYIWGAPLFIVVLTVSIVVDFYITGKINRSKTPKRLLTYSLIINIGLLAYFKYFNFFVANANDLLATVGFHTISWANIALPIGISFFTFQKISYAIDVYRKRSAPLQSLGNYMLYIILFPQLIAGPIVRYNEIASQLIDRKAYENAQEKLIGFYRFVIGLSKKVLIANSIGAYADLVFDAPPETYQMVSSWLGIVCYTMQIYFDFSGYSDMAIGLGKMMGFRFPENFNNPFVSKSIVEYWQRWHITLGNWMRDYIYIPLGGNRKGQARHYFNLWIVFFISGLWHGAGWTFVIWGALQGLFITLEKAFYLRFLKKGGVFSVFYMFMVTMLLFVIFRSYSMNEAFSYYHSLFDVSSFQLGVDMSTKTVFYLVIALLFSFITLNKKGVQLHHFLFERDTYSFKTHCLFSFTAMLFLVLSVGYITIQDFNPFIYFRF